MAMSVHRVITAHERQISLRSDRPAASPDCARPIIFLVSTTPVAGDARGLMGAPAYSYYFVLEALAPVLERLGAWKLVDHPESRLAFAAARARAEGFRPIHLAINPLQDVYLSPAMPNVVFPFWEFPEIPSRDFGDDTRQNWVRTCRAASLALTACEFTARSFRRAGVRRPVSVVPIPLEPAAFDLSAWDIRHSWTFTCRHDVYGPQPLDAAERTPAVVEPIEGTIQGRVWQFARRGFRRVEPWIDPETVGALVRLKARLAKSRGVPLGELAFAAVRSGYRRHVRRWLSQEALERISAAKAGALALLGREPTFTPDPPLDSKELTLGGGLVYLTIFNIGDPRKNYHDILTAFLIAFHDRPDVTLVIKLATNLVHERNHANVLRAHYEALGLSHRCRVVVITEFLSEEQMSRLFRATTYYVNASHAEGACLPLMRALAGGRPAIAPNHTAMADYMDDHVGFVLRSHPEPTHWPHDPEKRLETSRRRLVWSDLRDAFLESAEVADHRPERYAALAAAARARLARHASRAAAEDALRAALELLPDGPTTALLSLIHI